jgi:uncharacterized protein (UPF0264 family)
MTERVQLLVSVRDADEARAALAGGADLIDVKEPAHGSLGAAAPGVIADVVAAVAGRTPVSAALGELHEYRCELPAGVAYAKWGLAQLHGVPWQDAWHALSARIHAQPVVVAYADWQCAQAPPLDDVVAFACRRGGILLIDTHCKTAAVQGRRAHLLDWLSLPELTAIRTQCRQSGTRLALAGSLGPSELRTLLPLRPDWFAVRGAACDAHDRAAPVHPTRVRDLVHLLQS